MADVLGFQFEDGPLTAGDRSVAAPPAGDMDVGGWFIGKYPDRRAAPGVRCTGGFVSGEAMTHQVLRSGQRVVVHCTLLLIATLLVGAPASAAAPAGDAAPPE